MAKLKRVFFVMTGESQNFESKNDVKSPTIFPLKLLHELRQNKPPSYMIASANSENPYSSLNYHDTHIPGSLIKHESHLICPECVNKLDLKLLTYAIYDKFKRDFKTNEHKSLNSISSPVHCCKCSKLTSMPVRLTATLSPLERNYVKLSFPLNGNDYRIYPKANSFFNLENELFFECKTRYSKQEKGTFSVYLKSLNNPSPEKSFVYDFTKANDEKNTKISSTEFPNFIIDNFNIGSASTVFESGKKVLKAQFVTAKSPTSQIVNDSYFLLEHYEAKTTSNTSWPPSSASWSIPPDYKLTYESDETKDETQKTDLDDH